MNGPSSWRVIRVRPLLDAIFEQEPVLPDRIDQLELIERHHTEVYRARSGDFSCIIHLTPESTAYLTRVRDNLQRLAVLDEDRIPRVLAWRASDRSQGQEWAALLCSEVPGRELSPQTFSSGSWEDFCRLLPRLHELQAETPAGLQISNRLDEVTAFPSLAETLPLVVGLRGLPVSAERVQRHLAEMAEYVDHNSAAFQTEPRLIHGDLNRSNILVNGDRAAIIDWAELGAGDYAFDLAMLKFTLDSVVPRSSARLVRDLVKDYRTRFKDDHLELRMRFFLALPGLISAFWYASQASPYRAVQAWRVRTCYLHSEAQWKCPLDLDGPYAGAPAVPTEHGPLRLGRPWRDLFYLLAPKRLS